jgi:RimJ/RimL family protein N-acetyltransferase
MHDQTLFDRPDLITERLLLRRPEAGDIDAIVRAVGDREVAHRLSRVPHPYGAADAIFFLDGVVPAEWVWAVTLGTSNELIGAVGLTPGQGAQATELGYWLARAYWGRGLMTEAATAVVAYGFETLRLPCITSGYFEENPASGRVLEKLGFVETGRAMRPCLARGCDVRSVEMRLLPTR